VKFECSTVVGRLYNSFLLVHLRMH